MVSKASDDLPEPLNPVITTNLSRGMERLRFFKLCWRAPPILMNFPVMRQNFAIRPFGNPTPNPAKRKPPSNLTGKHPPLPAKLPRELFALLKPQVFISIQTQTAFGLSSIGIVAGFADDQHCVA